MLVLSRKKNESIVINDEITIVVVEIRGDKVRLGVEHPPGVPVHRREAYEAIRRVDPTPLRTEPALPPTPGQKALATIRSQIKSAPDDDASLIAAILEAVAAKGISANDVKDFVKEI